MKIAISGANGYIGKNLSWELQADQHTIVPIQREILYDRGKLTALLSDCQAVINLAGAPILQRWTDAGRKEILNSRVLTTQNLVQAINSLPELKKPHTFISTSAIGIYSPGSVHTENSQNFSTDFVGEVVQKWEDATSDLSPSVRKIIFRIAPVLGKESQTIQKLLPLFKMGLGGKIGKGTQPFPFIHIFDVVNAIVWGLQHKMAAGVYNLSAPQNIDNKTFTKALARAVKRPALFTAPAWTLQLSLGEASSLLLKSPLAKPQRLTDEGFVFLFPEINSCLAEITV